MGRFGARRRTSFKTVPTIATDVSGHPLQGHDCAGASVFGDACLIHINDVHDDATLEHLGQSDFCLKRRLLHGYLLSWAS